MSEPVLYEESEPGVAGVSDPDLGGVSDAGVAGVSDPGLGGVSDAGVAGVSMVRLRLGIAYDGVGFSGWARQPGRRTVQEDIETALGRLLRLEVAPALTVAGRTDAGVHARGQVAHVDVPEGNWAAAGAGAMRGLAGLLAGDVRVRSIAVAPAGFDARFSALWRRYSYRVCDDPAAADPLRRADTLSHRNPLDVPRMNEAAAACLGEHDFSAYCRRREGASTVRTLIRLEWQRPEPGVAVASVVADAFCHNMVRALMGALLAAGDGRQPVGWPREVLANGVRDPAVHVAPPHPLCLEEVRYPADAELAARALVTRRRR